MNEAETRAELIDPVLRSAGWGVVADSRVRRETICPGRIEGAGRRGKPEIADYVLTFRNHKLAVIEAKARDKGVTEGMAQAKAYAEKLQARFAYSTNGVGIYRADMETGKEGPVERYPTPDELWAEVFKKPNEWRDRFAAVPFEERGGTWQTRYYQHNAIENALEAIAARKQRILLTLATGTGKTAIAFQIAWALFQSRWNLSRKPERGPRILFLADRNILADQAYNAFSAFHEDALARIKPDEIRKKGRVPKNASVFFTIFQTFMSGTGADGKIINAEKSDVFDVLAYIAFAMAPISRAERADSRKPIIFARYDSKLQAFLDFVLTQYVRQGVGELDQEKLANLLELKYHSVNDAADELGGVPLIRDTFVGFQQYLYAPDRT